MNCANAVTAITITLRIKLTVMKIRLIGDVVIAGAFIGVINASVNNMPQTKEDLHRMYLEYIAELRRLKNEKYGEQLEFQFEEKAVAVIPKWRKKKKKQK